MQSYSTVCWSRTLTLPQPTVEFPSQSLGSKPPSLRCGRVLTFCAFFCILTNVHTLSMVRSHLHSGPHSSLLTNSLQRPALNALLDSLLHSWTFNPRLAGALQMPFCKKANKISIVLQSAILIIINMLRLSYVFDKLQIQNPICVFIVFRATKEVYRKQIKALSDNLEKELQRR